MKLFALDCAATAASVALFEEGRLLGERFLHVPQTHSVTLLPMAEELLKATGTAPADIGCYAVSCGPGSFTGLRIGIAAVKGLAFPHNTPCIGVSTLEALAYNLLGFEGTAVAVMDARCHQVYTALFSLKDRIITRLTEDAALPLPELSRLLAGREGPHFLVGDGASVTFAALKEEHPGLLFAPAPLLYERASGVGMAALAHPEDALPPAALLPSYLRPVHAMTLAERQKKER